MDFHTAFSLPDDILRLVIETYAFQCEVNDALRLFTVSRDVKSWVEPRVYSKVTLKKHDQVRLFGSALRDELPFCRPARHVKQLWFLCTSHFVVELFISGVLERCLNLVHLAFDGRRAPFPDSDPVNNNVWPRLTRLSIYSPYWVDNDFHASQPLIPWDRLTHLHFFGPGDINDSTLYETLLGRRIDQFTSLESMCIELTYPSPEAEIFNYTLFAETALFYLYLKENLLRELFSRLPHLRQVVIKTNFSYPRFRILWDDLAKNLKDEPRIVFEMKELRDQDFYENTLRDSVRPCSPESMAIWYKLTQNALEEINRIWDAEN
ncbi:uncharacterized protein FOMMEDRAFT_167892 [Fomitiporia mediterranea MF3/22]|uniref:uncharacterized protein n=1 Tax=Fomitiporia mediterranea (strain MF3/22) TaxID=694068 RepID=UPI000440889E|nr:uncharacterized protein FOMMEDRAFT_167892 [Fomitiporia mediterranea MF3/22]EJD02715.1 hypothetical protein FOMMEDRAFT_167892 [Fomitiporia mediterranea MF3/22]